MSASSKIKKSPRQSSYFPQFSRIFAALFLFSLFLASFLFSPSEKLKLAALKENKNPRIHLALAKEYKKVDDLGNARRELLIGLSLSSNDEELKKELKEVENLLAQPNKILGEIRKWGKITQEFPGYRDAYLKLASLYYQIYQNEKAQENLKKALELDPNFTPARELEKTLGD